jgi:transcriptional regulator with XRE-family HTH domain
MLTEQLYMNLGQCIKKVREAKGFSQKQVAASAKIDNSNYSKIENGKTDPTFSVVVRIAKALSVEPSELLKADVLFKESNSLNKSVQEKLLLIEQLEKKEKAAFYIMLDTFIGKKKLHDALSGVLQKVEG